MTGKRVSLDANILIYALDKDSGEKQQLAIDLIQKCATEYDCVLPLQALSEFYFAATRKGIVPHDEAVKQLEDWQLLFPTVLPSVHTISEAVNVVGKHNLSFWDAMLWSVACENGVRILYSEDFQDGRELKGVQFINPFNPHFLIE